MTPASPLPSHDPTLCGLDYSDGRQTCPACQLEAAKHSAAVRQLLGQADETWDEHLTRLEKLRDLIVGGPDDPRPPLERTPPDPARQRRRRQLLQDIDEALRGANS